MGGMPAEKDWLRLADLVRERRTDLDLTQEDVRFAGGPSTATLRNIEGGLQPGYQPAILRRLEDALQWQHGSVRAILDGGDPVLAGPAVPASTAPAPLAGTAATVSTAAAGDHALAGRIVRSAISDIEREVWAGIRARLEGTAPGAVLFKDPDQRAAWDATALWGRDLTPEARRVLDTADPAVLFDGIERTLWVRDFLPYRQRVSEIAALRSVRENPPPIQNPAPVRRVG